MKNEKPNFVEDILQPIRRDQNLFLLGFYSCLFAIAIGKIMENTLNRKA